MNLGGGSSNASETQLKPDTWVFSSFNSLSALVVFLKELWITNAIGASCRFPKIK